MKTHPFKFAFVLCEDAQNAAEFLAFHSNLKKMTPAEWVKLWGGYKRVSPRIRDVIERANVLVADWPNAYRRSKENRITSQGTR